MALLTFADVPTFLPEYDGAEEAAITALLSRAQDIAESSIGSNHPLELSTFKETLNVHRTTGAVFLSYKPIVQIVSIQVKSGGARRRSRRAAPSSNYVTLDPSSYYLEETNQINFNSSRPNFSSFVGGSANYSIHSQSTTTVPWTRAIVEYEAGFDTNEMPIPYELQLLKRAIAQLAMYLEESGSSAFGIKKNSTYQVNTIEYQEQSKSTKASGKAGTNNVFGIPDLYLIPFRKYAPRRSSL